ncbi:hypothetical protein MMC07_009884 [Pseudocyphellaria aurata]|nr:hypothetical protein [Pseudocyphellaria aurata]
MVNTGARHSMKTNSQERSLLTSGPGEILEVPDSQFGIGTATVPETRQPRAPVKDLSKTRQQFLPRLSASCSKDWHNNHRLRPRTRPMSASCAETSLSYATANRYRNSESSFESARQLSYPHTGFPGKTSIKLPMRQTSSWEPPSANGNPSNFDSTT